MLESENDDNLQALNRLCIDIMLSRDVFYVLRNLRKWWSLLIAVFAREMTLNCRILLWPAKKLKKLMYYMDIHGVMQKSLKIRENSKKNPPVVKNLNFVPNWKIWCFDTKWKLNLIEQKILPKMVMKMSGKFSY